MRLVIPNEVRNLPFEAKITLRTWCDAHFGERSFASLRMTTHRLFGLSLACFSIVGFAMNAAAQLPELKPVELVDWDCLNKPEGIAKTEDGKERNRQKNRSPAILTFATIMSLDTPAFLARA